MYIINELMKIDKETKIYLHDRVKLNSPNHHELSPIELRKARLSQLALDDLKGPALENVFDLKVGDQEDSKFSIRVYVPSKIKTNEKVPVILFFHGGGFVMGNLETHDYPCRCIAKFSEMVVIAVDYRLAPEYKFPVSLNDAKYVHKNLHKFSLPFNIDLENILVCGDSAGGNLATILAINYSYNLLPKIKGQILIYPCVDLTLSMKSMDIQLDGLVFSGKTMSYFVKHYLENRVDEVNWEASPLYAPNLSNQPPAYIFAAGLDPLLDEGIAYKNRLKDNGNIVHYKLYEGQIHGFVTNSKHFPKGLECLKEIGIAAKDLVRS